jgi:hypothetical protein
VKTVVTIPDEVFAGAERRTPQRENPEVKYIAMQFGNTSTVTAAMRSPRLWIGFVPG